MPAIQPPGRRRYFRKHPCGAWVGPRMMQPFMATKSTSAKSGLRQKAQLMSASEIVRTLVRLAHEIVENNGGFVELWMVVIRRRVVLLAERLVKIIHRMESSLIPVGPLDLILY